MNIIGQSFNNKKKRTPVYSQIGDKISFISVSTARWPKVPRRNFAPNLPFNRFLIIYCIRTCWWAQAAAIMTSLVSFSPPGTGCGEGRSERMFSYQVFYFCNPTCFKPAGKAAHTIARRSKSSRQLNRKFLHTRKTPKMRSSTTNNLGFSCRQLIHVVVDGLIFLRFYSVWKLLFYLSTTSRSSRYCVNGFPRRLKTWRIAELKYLVKKTFFLIFLLHIPFLKVETTLTMSLLRQLVPTNKFWCRIFYPKRLKGKFGAKFVRGTFGQRAVETGKTAILSPICE